MARVSGIQRLYGDSHGARAHRDISLSSAEASFVLLFSFVRKGRRGPGEREKMAARGECREGEREKRGFCHILSGWLVRFAVRWLWLYQGMN